MASLLIPSPSPATTPVKALGTQLYTSNDQLKLSILCTSTSQRTQRPSRLLTEASIIFALSAKV